MRTFDGSVVAFAKIAMIDPGLVGSQGLLRKCIIGADSERILKIHLEQPDSGVYWAYSRAVISVTGCENRATT
jgi:hypothetical protein